MKTNNKKQNAEIDIRSIKKKYYKKTSKTTFIQKKYYSKILL